MKTKQMIINVTEDYAELSNQAADLVIETVNEKPNALLCIAGGDTPLGMLQRLTKAAEDHRVDFSACRFVVLDEWVGLSKEDEGSCQHFLHTNFFDPLQINMQQVHSFDAKAQDLEHECKKINRAVDELKGIDLIILGVGVNGHLGFNEPGCDFSANAHIINLDPVTQSVGAKYFNNDDTLVPTQGITLGINQIMQANQTIAIVNGAKKREAVQAMLYNELSSDCPATILRKHDNFQLIVDKEAFPED